MANNYRAGRLSQEIQREVNDILLKEVRDPRVDGVTLTEVEVTGDLQEATIYYSTLETSEEGQAQVQEGLDKAKGLIRKLLGQRMTTYHTPVLSFVRDRSLEYGNRIDSLLDQLNSGDK